MYKIKHTKRSGRGIYAERDIPQGTRIVTNDMIVGDSNGDLVRRYAFDYDGKNSVAIALGDISLINHSATDYNCEVVVAKAKKFPRATLVALCDIKSGDELLINYGYEPKT